MTLGTLPEKLSAAIDVMVREAFAFSPLSNSLHFFDCELGRLTNWTPGTRLYSDQTRSPLVAILALPKQVLAVVDVLIRQAPPTSGGGNRLHLRQPSSCGIPLL